MELRLSKDDFSTIFHYLGSLISMLAIPMGVSLLLAIAYRETAEICNFILSIGILLVVGETLRLVTFNHGVLTAKRAMLLTGFAWIFTLFLGAIPLFLSGHYVYYLDAVFEVASGLTTTGLTLVQDLDHMAVSTNTWRFLLQMVGGQGILVAAISLGIFSKSSSTTTMYNSEGRSDHILPTIRDTARFIWWVSLIIILIGTVIGGAIIFVCGEAPALSAIQSFCLSVAAFDTGGFSPYSTNLIFYHSFPLEILLTVIGFLGAINFMLYAEMNHGDKLEMFKNIESRTFFIWALLMFLLCIGCLAAAGQLRSLPALIRRGIFTILSALTNTGFSNLYSSQMTGLMISGALFAIVLAMTVGGSTGSTSGGIKALRVGIVVKSLVHHIKMALLPDSAVSTSNYHHIHRQTIKPEMVSLAYTITLLYILMYVIGAVVGIVLGYDAIPAMFESVSAGSNTGLSSGLLAVGTPAVLKVVYIAEMIIGRFEFMTILALITALFASIVPRRFENWVRRKKRERNRE